MKVAVVVGGLSSEREVSLQTGRAFAKACDRLKYDFEVIDAGRDLPVKLGQLQPDVALLALHGKLAEDGTVQGLCEYLKIPYTGAGVLGSALAMNKVLAKQIFRYHGLPTPEWQVVDFRREMCAVPPELDFPLVVKPTRDGSSVGLTICHREEEWEPALELAARYDKLILVEEFIAGQEVTVPIFEERPLTSIEIVPKQGHYDYENKYTVGKTDYFLPARLEPVVLQELNRVALQAFQVLEGRFYGRVDFRVTEDHRPYLLEVNTLPGCTETSLVPKAAAHEGLSFEDFIERLVAAAALDYGDVS